MLLIFSGVSLYRDSASRRDHVSYWLWAGLTAKDAPANSELYVFQGRISTDGGKTFYERQGLCPHPLKSSKLFLVYRLEGQLPDAKDVVDIFERSVAQWQRHPVSVSGIQLDFDSPTSKLIAYSHFVEEVRRQLAQNFALSITGLGDWAINGNQETMQSISSSTDEIVFQLYQGRRPLREIEIYIRELSEYPMPFRIGLISGAEIPTSVNTLKVNPNFQGIVYFIKKAI
ncbi:MAG: DUF3142 domain-containing protein [Candidatus Zixiibacteriota bacterium]